MRPSTIGRRCNGLVAIYWVGNGNFCCRAWEQARELALQRLGKSSSGYLTGEPNLGDFLEEGITSLGYLPKDFGP
jgi:hypothetical protein